MRKKKICCQNVTLQRFKQLFGKMVPKKSFTSSPWAQFATKTDPTSLCWTTTEEKPLLDYIEFSRVAWKEKSDNKRIFKLKFMETGNGNVKSKWIVKRRRKNIRNDEKMSKIDEGIVSRLCQGTSCLNSGKLSGAATRTWSESDKRNIKHNKVSVRSFIHASLAHSCNVMLMML